MLISELVSYQIQQTESDLQSTDGLNDYAAIKASAIDRAKVEFYGTAVIPGEASINDVVKFYLADVAVYYLSETAIDWYLGKTVVSQSQGDETIRYYDRVASLRVKASELRLRIAQAAGRIKAIAFGSGDLGDLASLPLAQAQAEGRSKVTKDPWVWARFLYGDYVQIDDGILPKTIVVDRP